MTRSPIRRGEIVYLRDEETGDFWSATPAPIRHASPYTVRHEAGASVFEHQHAGIATTLTLGMAPDDPVKIARLEIVNRGTTPRRLTVTTYVEWTLGVVRERTQYEARTRFDRASQAIFGRNYFDRLYAEDVAFSWISGVVASHTGDRREFLGRNGNPTAPAAMSRQRLGERSGLDIDPCAALQTVVTLAPGETTEVIILLGAAPGEDAARALIERYRAGTAAADALAAAASAWDRRLATVSVWTPSTRIRRDGEPLVALSGALLPHVGPLGGVPVERRVRVPRPAPGRHVVRLRRAGRHPRAPDRRGRPPVRRGRRAALVASPERPRRPHPHLRRPRVAPLLPRPLRPRHRRPRRAR